MLARDYINSFYMTTDSYDTYILYHNIYILFISSYDIYIIFMISITPMPSKSMNTHHAAPMTTPMTTLDHGRTTTLLATITHDHDHVHDHDHIHDQDHCPRPRQ
jgi:hypothetical protein